MVQFNLDCLELIFNKLQDKKSFHSCLLVNKEWCRLVVPILWKKYSWYNINKSILNVILYFLPSSSKQLLSDNNIILPTTILLKPPLFNYINFCEFPDSYDVKKIIRMVLDMYDYDSSDDSSDDMYRSDDKRIMILERVIYKLFFSQCKNIKRLQWLTPQPLLLIPGASTCFSQLNSLFVSLKYMNSNTLYELAQICKDLNELGILYCSKDLPGLVSLIDSQKNLSKVRIYRGCSRNKGRYEEQSEALARKGNIINTLHLTLGTIPPSFLTSLINLTTISISNNRYCKEDYKIKEFQQYLAISEFPNLQSLIVDGLSCFKELAMLMEKTKGNILRVDINTFITGALIEAIVNNCPNIEYLDIHLKPNEFIHIKSLLLNCEKLIDITFRDTVDSEYDDGVGDELLDSLAKFSPKPLTGISISGMLKYSVDAFKQFFGSYREKSLRYVHINVLNFTKSHESVVKEYIDERMIEFRHSRMLVFGSGKTFNYCLVKVYS